MVWIQKLWDTRRIPSSHPEALPQLLWEHRDQCALSIHSWAAGSPFKKSPRRQGLLLSPADHSSPLPYLHLACKKVFVKTSEIRKNFRAGMLLLFEIQWKICRRWLTCSSLLQVFFSWNNYSDVLNGRCTKLYRILHILLLWKVIHF